MSNIQSNWFTDNLPMDIAERHDGKFNVWSMTAVKIDEEIDLKWQVVGVFHTKEEAEEFVSNA
jgi:hypothetical protein